jgi:hypothetical protein
LMRVRCRRIHNFSRRRSSATTAVNSFGGSWKRPLPRRYFSSRSVGLSRRRRETCLR